jgi:hypothetical protein
VLRRAQQSHHAAQTLRDNTEPANLEDALARLRAVMERKQGSDFYERLLLAEQEQNKNNAYFKVLDEGDFLMSIKQSVDQFYKSLEQDDALGVALHIKDAVSKLHSTMPRNQDYQEDELLMTSAPHIDDRHRQQQLAVVFQPLDANVVSATIHDLTTAVQEDDLDAVTCHIHTIMTDLQRNMVAVLYALEEAEAVVDTAAELGSRLLFQFRGDDTQTTAAAAAAAAEFMENATLATSLSNSNVVGA